MPKARNLYEWEFILQYDLLYHEVLSHTGFLYYPKGNYSILSSVSNNSNHWTAPRPPSSVRSALTSKPFDYVMVLNICNTSIIDRYINARCIFRDWYGVNERYAYFIYVAKLALMKLETLLELMAREHCNFLWLERGANLHFFMPLKLKPLQNHHTTASFCGQA